MRQLDSVHVNDRAAVGSLQFSLATMLWFVVIAALLIGASLRIPIGASALLLVTVLLAFLSQIGLIGVGETSRQLISVCLTYWFFATLVVHAVTELSFWNWQEGMKLAEPCYFLLVIALFAFQLPSGTVIGLLMESLLQRDCRPWRRRMTILLIAYSLWVLTRYDLFMTRYD